METVINYIQNHALMFSSTILIVAYIFIAWEKISKVTVAMLGAALTLILGLLAQSKGHDTIDPHYFINFVDFNVIFLLISMMIIVGIASKSGIFTWIANALLKKTKGHPTKILITLGCFTAFASAFLDNVTTVILVVPVTFLIAKTLDINPIPYLITEILASNIGGTATLIGDPPNIIIGSKAGFTFMTFLLELTDIVCLIFAVSMTILVFTLDPVDVPPFIEHFGLGLSLILVGIVALLMTILNKYNINSTDKGDKVMQVIAGFLVVFGIATIIFSYF